MELVDGSKRVGTNQEPAQLVLLGISDCAVVRSTTDGHDAHVTYCNFASHNGSKDHCNFADCNIASHNGSKDNSNIAGFSGCFCVPRRLV